MPLNAQVEQVMERLRGIEGELRAVEAELDTYAADRQRFDLLRDVCTSLDRLGELEAGHLFWGEIPEVTDVAGHMVRLRNSIIRFDNEIRVVLDKQAHLKAKANRCLEDLDYLDEEIHDAYARDERRENEFAVDRDISPIPEHLAVMPWRYDDATDRRYRRTLLMALLLALLLGIVVHLVVVPVLVRPPVAQIPERLAMMVRKEYKKPEPVKKAKGERKEDKKQAGPADDRPAPDRPNVVPAEQVAAPKRAENTGMLAFKESFKDLIDETPVAKLGAEARLNNPATHTVGQAVASRALVSMLADGGAGGGIGNAAGRSGGSGGIGNAAIGRAAGGGRGKDLGLGGSGFAQVKSGIGGSGSGSGGAKDGKSSGASGRPARTDEEIQLLFDRYKAALYRIYNTELRKDPTLRGKMVLRLTIEPSGVVSACAVDSTNMNAPEFSSQIVERVKKFNFGPKDGVPKTTIFYPIDFLPAR